MLENQQRHPPIDGDNRKPKAESVAAPGGRPDPSHSPWRTVGAREVYRNPWLAVTEYAVIRPDGQPGIYAVVDPGDNVSVVPLDDEERVWLVGEFRYPTQRYAWTLPSGKVEAGEDSLAAARRELAEETGLQAAAWELLGAHPLSDGISTQISHIYLAYDLRQGEARPEGTEQLTLRRLPLREAVEACRTGEIADATSVLGIWGAWLRLRSVTG
jgi:8-oxo-dGTP pyrophosphatase MutT (NUDIX family)